MRLLGSQTSRLGHPRYLTEFADRSSPRPATDELYFVPSTGGDVTRPVVTVPQPIPVPIPVEPLALGLLGGLIVWSRRRARAR